MTGNLSNQNPILICLVDILFRFAHNISHKVFNSSHTQAVTKIPVKKTGIFVTVDPTGIEPATS